MGESSPSLSPLHRAWRKLPQGPRRWAFVRGTTMLAPKPDRVPAPVTAGVGVVGEVSRASGLGTGARLMGAALEAQGIAHWMLDIGDRLPGGAVVPPAVMPPPGVPLVFHVNPPSLGWAMLRLPKDALAGRRVIGYWAWELPVMPALWRVGLQLVHEIWVPSRFTAAAIAQMLPADGRIKLHVVPHPVAAVPQERSPLDRAAFGLPETAVVVLCGFNLASSLVRKNPLAAIAAFKAAFGSRSDRLLVLKVGHAHHFPDDFAQIRAAVADAGNIRIVTAELSVGDTHALTACADIVLSLHRSEGFGLLPAEAMLLGRAVIATGWSGNMDFMDAQSAALVGYRLVPAVDPRGVLVAPGAIWAEADIGEAAGWLQRFPGDAGLRAAFGARATAMVRERLVAAPLHAAVTALGLPA